MLTTDFVLGTPGWLDIGALDIASASAFYTAVFDWEFHSAGPDAGYGMFTKGSRVAAAVGQLDEEGERPAWMIYFRTSDAQATADQVRRAGGAVRSAPFDVPEHGRMAQFSDPQGGKFAVWEPGKDPGLAVVDEPGSLNWVELMTTDTAAAKDFYGRLFGWTTSDMELPGGGGAYSVLAPSGADPNLAHGGMIALNPADLPEGRAYWHPVFAVADCDLTVATVTDRGGKVKMGPQDAEGVGRLAVCEDPAGAEFVVLIPSAT